MKTMHKWPHTERFESLVKDIRQKFEYSGRDENDEPTYDSSKPKPIISFTGTVKLDGTNVSFAYNYVDGWWAQSREQMLNPPEVDNVGFGANCIDNLPSYLKLAELVALINNVNLNKYTIVIFGEWVGPKIMKRTAISKLKKKSFFLFGAKVVPIVDAPPTGVEELIFYYKDIEDRSYFLPIKDITTYPDANIYNIYDYPTYSITIDFNHPANYVDQLTTIVNEVEAQCPVGKAFDIEGIGEGAVFTGTYEGKTYMFKCKGEAHSMVNPKAEKIAAEPEKLASVQEFVNFAVTENRVDQAITQVFGINGTPDIRKTGEILKWAVNDILREEADAMEASGLEKADVTKALSIAVKNIFIEKTKVL